MPYTLCRPVAVNHAKVGGSTHTDFPMLFAGTYPFLATIANGGQVTSASGHDIIFTSDAAGQNKLSHEVESYTAATGAVIMWVRLPTLSNVADTVIYLWYGNPAVTTSQQDASGTWVSYPGVYHLKDGTTLSLADIGSNAQTLDNIGGATAAAGQVDGAMAVVGNAATSTYQYAYLSNASYLDFTTGSFSVEVWAKYASQTSAANNYPGIISKSQNDAGKGWGLYVDPVNNFPYVYVVDGSAHTAQIYDSAARNDSTWRRFAFVVDRGLQQLRYYVNGVQVGSSLDITAVGSLTSTRFFALGVRGSTAGYVSPFTGSIDEARVSSAVRSADWFLAAYNSESDAANFYAVGAPLPPRRIIRVGLR